MNSWTLYPNLGKRALPKEIANLFLLILVPTPRYDGSNLATFFCFRSLNYVFYLIGCSKNDTHVAFILRQVMHEFQICMFIASYQQTNKMGMLICFIFPVSDSKIAVKREKIHRHKNFIGWLIYLSPCCISISFFYAKPFWWTSNAGMPQIAG